MEYPHKSITWKKFAAQVRSNGCNLFRSLNEYPDAILVAGCQRSGTTIISRVIKKSTGIQSLQLCKDDELSDAIILSGMAKPDINGRSCFQTTYLNECLNEYIENDRKYKLIWVIRNPYSVIYSMIYHWKAFAFNELFYSVGIKEITWKERRRYDLFGRWGLSKINKACMSYVAKNKQLFKLKKKLPKEIIYVLDYDKLIKNKTCDLENLYKFINIDYNKTYSDMINDLSINKYKKLSKREVAIIKQRCQLIYDDAISLANNR